MKRRIQIQVEEEDHKLLKRWAVQRGLSISAAVRWLVRTNLRPAPPGEDARIRAFIDASGAIRAGAGKGDVSRRHDEVLYGDES